MSSTLWAGNTWRNLKPWNLFIDYLFYFYLDFSYVIIVGAIPSECSWPFIIHIHVFFFCFFFLKNIFNFCLFFCAVKWLVLPFPSLHFFFHFCRKPYLFLFWSIKKGELFSFSHFFLLMISKRQDIWVCLNFEYESNPIWFWVDLGFSCFLKKM